MVEVNVNWNKLLEEFADLNNEAGFNRRDNYHTECIDILTEEQDKRLEELRKILLDRLNKY